MPYEFKNVTRLMERWKHHHMLKDAQTLLTDDQCKKWDDDYLKAKGEKNKKQAKAQAWKNLRELLQAKGSDSFFYVGAEERGNANTGVSKVGGGVKFGVSVNPTAALGFNTEISAGIAATAASQDIVVMYVEPVKLAGTDIPNNITLLGLHGLYFDGKLKAGVDLNVGWSAGVKSSTSGDAVDDKAWVGDDSDDGSWALELGAASIEAKAGVKANADYVYKHYYGADPEPQQFARADGTVKFRAAATSLLNKERPLTQGVKDLGLAFVGISSHAGSGSVGAYAKASGDASALGLVTLSTEASATSKLAGSYSKTYVRFQTVAQPTGHAFHHTFDTVITYSSYDINALKLEVDAKLTAMKVDVTEKTPVKWLKDKAEEMTKKVNEKTYKGMKRMRYRTAIGVWERPKAAASDVPALKGTGVANGESIIIHHLRKIYTVLGAKATSASGKTTITWAPATKAYKPEGHPLVVDLAHRLGVTVAQLKTFLGNYNVYELIVEENQPELTDAAGGVIIEAIFASKDGVKLALDSGKVKTTTDEGKTLKDDGDGTYQLKNSFADALFAAEHTLQSMRLRFRHGDMTDRSKGFGIGFNVQGWGLDVGVKKVEQTGTDALLDLATVFFDDALIKLFDKAETTAQAYESAVPATILFSQ